MEKSKAVRIAYEIAEALNDLHSIDWHISLAKKFPEDVLMAALADVLSKEGIRNPAAYYNSSIKRYAKHSRD